MGRSRGGLTTQIHALVDANGLPIALKLTEGQAHDGRSAADMLERLGAGQTLLGDRGHDGDALRTSLADRGAWANVKPMPNRTTFLPSALSLALSLPGRTLLQQAQALQGRCNALREARRQLPRPRSRAAAPVAGWVAARISPHFPRLSVVLISSCGR